MKIKEIKFVDDTGKTCRVVPHCNVNIQMMIDPMYCHIKMADESEKIINVNEPYFTTYKPFIKDEKAIFTKYDDEECEDE